MLFFRVLVLFNLSWAAGNKVALLICLGVESEEHSVGGPESFPPGSWFPCLPLKLQQRVVADFEKHPEVPGHGRSKQNGIVLN